jgi:hypothetical protein
MTLPPFDERAVLCDNRRAVSNFRAVVFLPVLALLAVSGCEKTNDLPRLQEEAQATLASYQLRAEELVQRANAVAQRFAALPRDAPDPDHATMIAQRTFLQARAVLERTRITLRQVPKRVEDEVKAGKTDELGKLVSGLHDELEISMREANGELSAIESWVAIAEQRKSAVPSAAAPAGSADEPSSSGTTNQ